MDGVVSRFTLREFKRSPQLAASFASCFEGLAFVSWDCAATIQKAAFAGAVVGGVQSTLGIARNFSKGFTPERLSMSAFRDRRRLELSSIQSPIHDRRIP